jgi:hypothetical protein
MQWWRIGGSSLQYGYGAEAQANEYCERLNRNRDINLYAAELAADDVAADLDAGKRNDGIDLTEELADAEGGAQ